MIEKTIKSTKRQQGKQKFCFSELFQVVVVKK